MMLLTTFLFRSGEIQKILSKLNSREKKRLSSISEEEHDDENEELEVGDQHQPNVSHLKKSLLKKSNACF